MTHIDRNEADLVRFVALCIAPRAPRKSTWLRVLVLELATARRMTVSHTVAYGENARLPAKRKRWNLTRLQKEWRRHPDSNWGMTVLQTVALGHLAMPPLSPASEEHFYSRLLHL